MFENDYSAQWRMTDRPTGRSLEVHIGRDGKIVTSCKRSANSNRNNKPKPKWKCVYNNNNGKQLPSRLAYHCLG